MRPRLGIFPLTLAVLVERILQIGDVAVRRLHGGMSPVQVLHGAQDRGEVGGEERSLRGEAEEEDVRVVAGRGVGAR